MRVMVIVKASKDSEAGILPSTELLEKMGKYNEELVKAGVMLAADLGGTNFRVGLVELNLRKGKELANPKVLEIDHWCHADEKGITREQSIERLTAMLTKLTREATKRDLHLAPVIGVGCPGVIDKDGSIVSGAQNLPGNWKAANFHLPHEISSRMPRIGEHHPTVMLHNDAVVQGLSQSLRIRKRRHWGIFTIGTGLGNARFTTRESPDD